jgi:hypothetical protein
VRAKVNRTRRVAFSWRVKFQGADTVSISRPLSLAAKTCSWRGIENGADSGINPAGREQFEAPNVEAGRSGQWPRWWG